MCGIAGFIGGGDKRVAEAMQDTLEHRGPDAGRSLVIGQVGLAHRRLAVIDLSVEGVQPMSTKDGRYTIVYNGEVYNFRALQKQFLSDVSLQSSTDTEIILQLFAKFGPSSFDHLEGMYALAIYDRAEDTLYLHRDRLGKKPLYYTTAADGSFIFGSELKALRVHPSFRVEVDVLSVQQYLLYEYVPGPRTIYRGVYKLSPGATLTISSSGNTATFAKPITYQAPAGASALQQLEALLHSAVAERLVADVPVGVFLSGGLDSSVVAAFAQEHASQPIKTFSIGFEVNSFNEQAEAETVASHLGTEHYPMTLSLSEIARLLPQLPEVLDEPMGDSSIIPTLLVSEHARRSVTVALSGDGADEIFLGYDTFFAHRVANAFRYTPRAVRHALYTLARQMPVSHQYMSFDFKLKRFLSGCVVPAAHRNTVWLSAFQPAAISSLMNQPVHEADLFAPVAQWHDGQSSVWEGVKQEYLQGYLVDDILVKTDRASMHYGLEVRSPFLDEALVAFAQSLPDRQKLRGRTGKYILKQLAISRLPRDIVYRKKHGFNFPVGEMIRNELKDEFQGVLLDGGVQKLDIFNRATIEHILTEHVDGQVDHRKALWSLYVLGKWAEKWV